MTAREAQLGLHGEGDDPLAGLQAAAGVAHELEMVRLKGGEAGLLGLEVGQAGAVALLRLRSAPLRVERMCATSGSNRYWVTLLCLRVTDLSTPSLRPLTRSQAFSKMTPTST